MGVIEAAIGAIGIWVPLLIWVGVWLLLRKTYKIKNKILQWCLIVIPPLPLLLMTLVPWDIGSVILWAPVYAILLISLFKLCIYPLKSHFKPDAVTRIQLIRPLLSIVFIILARTLVYASLVSADNYAVKIATEMQRQVTKDGKCPEHIEGWERDYYGRSYKLYDKYGTKYKIGYYLPTDNQEFIIYVYHNIDEGFDIKGGVGKILRTTGYVNGKNIEIPLAIK
jgi:hypothetical protein